MAANIHLLDQPKPRRDCTDAARAEPGRPLPPSPEALPDRAGLTTFHDAVYFSIVTITTLGNGDLTLAPKWELLAGMEAMVRIVAFGLTTALLFAVVQKCWRLRHH